MSECINTSMQDLELGLDNAPPSNTYCLSAFAGCVTLDGGDQGKGEVLTKAFINTIRNMESQSFNLLTFENKVQKNIYKLNMTNIVTEAKLKILNEEHLNYWTLLWPDSETPDKKPPIHISYL